MIEAQKLSILYDVQRRIQIFRFMHQAVVTIKALSVFYQSRYHDEPKLNKELADAYEQRTWRSKLHINEEGYVYFSPNALKNCLSEAAKYLSVQIPGKGKSTYTKHFESGVLVIEPMVLPVKAEDVNCQALMVPSDGVRGSGKRVKRYYPVIPMGWEAKATFMIMDDMITEEVFLYHLKQAGQLIGLGTFRVRNNNSYGRFKVVDCKWSDIAADEAA